MACLSALIHGFNKYTNSLVLSDYEINMNIGLYEGDILLLKWNVTSQATSGNFAKVFNFTELKNFILLKNSVPIALSVFMVVDIIRSELEYDIASGILGLRENI